MKFWSKTLALALMASTALMAPASVVAQPPAGPADTRVAHMLPPQMIDIADIPIFETSKPSEAEEMQDDADDEEQPEDYVAFSESELEQHGRDSDTFDDEDAYLDEKDVDDEEDEEDEFEDMEDEDEDAAEDDDEMVDADDDVDEDELNDDDEDFDDEDFDDDEDAIDEHHDDVDVDEDEDDEDDATADEEAFPTTTLEFDDYGEVDDEAEAFSSFMQPHVKSKHGGVKGLSRMRKTVHMQRKRRTARRRRKRNTIISIAKRQHRRRAAGLPVKAASPKQIWNRRHRRNVKLNAGRTKRRLRNHRRRRNKLGKMVHRKVRKAITRARQRGRCAPGRVRRVFKEKHLKCRVVKTSPDCLRRRQRINRRRRDNTRIKRNVRNQLAIRRGVLAARKAAGPRRMLLRSVARPMCRPNACARRRRVAGAFNRAVGANTRAHVGGGVCATRGSTHCIRKNNHLRNRKIQRHKRGIRNLRHIKNRRNLLQCVPTRATARRNRHQRNQRNYPRYDPRTGRPVYQQPRINPRTGRPDNQPTYQPAVPVGFSPVNGGGAGSVPVPVSEIDRQNQQDMQSATSDNGAPLAQTATQDPLLAQQTNDAMHQQATSNEKKKSSKTTMIIIVASVVGLFLVGGIVYALTRSGKQQQQVNSMMMNPMVM